MGKIKLKRDFFWRCYAASFNGDAVVQPTNLCSYFWRGVSGLLEMLAGAAVGQLSRLYSAMPVWLMLVLGTASLAAGVFVTPALTSRLAAAAALLAAAIGTIGLLAVGAVTVLVNAWNKYLATRCSVKTQENIGLCILGILLWGIACVILINSALARTVGLLMLILPAVVAIVAGGAYAGWRLAAWFGDSRAISLLAVALDYLGAVKARVCPLVEPPTEDPL